MPFQVDKYEVLTITSHGKNMADKVDHVEDQEGEEKHKINNKDEKTQKKDEITVDPKLLQKYQRGRKNKLWGVHDKKLRGKLEKYEKKSKEAAVQAARLELLLPEESGYVEAEGLEKTFKFKQRDISAAVDIASAQKHFELKLDKFGPYSFNYTRNGRFLLLGGKKGHIATIDWPSKTLGCEVHVQETIRDVKWLHIETMFAVAQRKYVYIYDHTGMELHCLKKHKEVTKMEFLPYHFLLATVGTKGFLTYQDTSTGKLIVEHKTKLGPCYTMAQNPYNSVIHLGHHNGTVTMWSPSMPTPLVKMLCHRGPVRAIAIDNSGVYMSTSGLDGQLKIWDVRTYRQLQAYYTPRPGSSLHISQRGLLAVGCGPHVQIWQDAFRVKQKSPYLTHMIPSCDVNCVQFCPFEDVLGVSHSMGFASLLTPGSGEPNIDALELNPYQTKKQRQEQEVKSLLEKIQPELICLEPSKIMKVDSEAKKIFEEEKKQEGEEAFDPKYKKKGRSSAKRMYQRKKGVAEQTKKEQLREKNLEEQKKARREKQNEQRLDLPKTALDRFKPYKRAES